MDRADLVKIISEMRGQTDSPHSSRALHRRYYGLAELTSRSYSIFQSSPADARRTAFRLPDEDVYEWLAIDEQILTTPAVATFRLQLVTLTRNGCIDWSETTGQLQPNWLVRLTEIRSVLPVLTIPIIYPPMRSSQNA